MPSLRRSLIAYFLILLATALGGVSLITYRVAADALDKRLDSERSRIQVECDYQQKQVTENFNAKLLDEAERLGRDLRSKFALLNLNQRWEEETQRTRLRLALLTMSEAGLPGPAGFGIGTTVWMTQHLPTRSGLFFSLFSAVSLDESVRKSFETGEHAGYFQLHVFRGAKPYRPADQPFELPLEPDSTLTDAGDYKWITHSVPGFGLVRGVVYRTYLQIPRFGGRVGRSPDGSIRSLGERGPGRSTPGDQRAPSQPPDAPPPVFIQVVRSQTELDEKIASLISSCEDQLETVETGTAVERQRLRTNLALIAGIAFVGLVVGGWLVIGVGLSPLRKLSDAVSRVSEKDFRLPIERQQLTEELAPIHDRLTHSLEALKHAFEREKEAVADISHELRTPVASLLATIDVSLRKPRTAEQYKQTLEDCRDITKQLGGLVERVMTLAYLDAGQTAVTKATTDVADVADGCASVIRPLAESHGLTLTTEVSEPVELSTDADKLREVILNLLHNAVEYNQPGGQVRLCVRSEPNAKRVVVEVSDTGIGMTPDVKGKIFERFYRADPSRTATGVHAGLGLAIVKEYVSRLGGRISVDSEPGQGSTFRITLPA
jgi:signal transduction histidine kinase